MTRSCCALDAATCFSRARGSASALLGAVFQGQRAVADEDDGSVHAGVGIPRLGRCRWGAAGCIGSVLGARTSPLAGDLAERGSGAASGAAAAAAVGDGQPSGDLRLRVFGRRGVDGAVGGDVVRVSRACRGGYEGAGGSGPIRLSGQRSGL